MNIVTSELSLYQLTQDSDHPLVSKSIGAETLKSYVSSIIDLVIEKQFQAKVWVKLPQTKSWVDQVQKLQQKGNVEYIYLCNINNNHSALSKLNYDSPKTQVLSVEFNTSPLLQRESFLIILSTDFCSLVLAQWQKGKICIEPSGKRLQQPYLEMVSSFEPQKIFTILSKIQQNILPSLTLSLERDLVTFPNLATKSDFLEDLILKQVESGEELQKIINSLSKKNHNSEKNSTNLGLQDDFFNDLVRELRSPITHMKTALSLLESKQIKGEQRQRYLKMVSDECDRQNSLVSGLLELLQLDSPIEIEYLYLDDLVPGIVSTYQPLAEEKEIQLGYTIPKTLPPIACPQSWFRQIIINLLNNSLRFTPPQGRVFVQAVFKDGYIEISVTDTGIGIPTKEINKIFDGFYRTKAYTSEKGTGAGLGLTLVRQLIQRCGGTISVSSKVGKGTTFKILMPAVPAELILT